MSYTYRDLQDQVYEQLSINSDDTNIDRAFITDIIDDFRALFLRNEYNRTRTIDEEVIQYIKDIRYFHGRRDLLKDERLNVGEQ